MKDFWQEEIKKIVNVIKRANAPVFTSAPNSLKLGIICTPRFDVTDNKKGSGVIVGPGKGQAHYINAAQTPYNLVCLSYDEYLHEFVFDDGDGHSDMNALKDGVKVADLILYDSSENQVYFIVHELSSATVGNKRNVGKRQLSDTLNQLYTSENLKQFIDGFARKLCILSAEDGRVATSTPDNVADGFLQVYQIIPEPLKFNFGQIKRWGFDAYETSTVILEP